MSIISIYHRVGEGQFREFNGAVDNQLEHVYSYLDDTWDDDDSTDPTVFLERVFRQNNSVDGNEINVQKNKRSLSVGDVVGLPDTTYWTVNGLGWEQVDSDDVGFALSNSNNGYEEAGQLCPRCAQVSLMVPTTSNALSRTTRDPDDIPIGPTFLQRPEGGSLVNRARADYNLQFIDTGVTPSPDEYIVAANAAGLGNEVTTESDWLRMRARYMANMTLVDRMVGDITDALERAGIADNTAVVFTSDHGEMIGDHAMLEKRSLYEEASRVPLLIRAPWIGGGDKVPGSISQIDLVPTLLDLLDDDIPVHLQGTSQLGVLKGEETLDDNDVFIQWNGIHPEMEDRHLGSAEINRMLTLPWRSVVSDRWKLNLCAGDQCELFDLRSDPHEMNNLFNDPTHRDRIRDMAARVHTWQVRTGDTAPLPSV